MNAVFPSSHPASAPVALFDANHGQPNWAQTGFTSRQLDTNFAGVTEQLCRMGFRCQATNGECLATCLRGARLLVIPPPTGRYDSKKERWQQLRTSLFSSDEVRDILAFLREGGRLLAFAYRFGDSFTRTNLGALVAPLGCLLNDDAVIDLHTLHSLPPLQLYLDTHPDALPFSWAAAGVTVVRWRPMATFTLLPGSTARPLALSSGGSCISFNRTLRQISFESLPIAVAGQHGQGKFVLVGGPHAFETGKLGLLYSANNARLLANVLRWLVSAQDALSGDAGDNCSIIQAQTGFAHELSRINCQGEGERTVRYVENVLRRTGVLRALSQARWFP